LEQFFVSASCNGSKPPLKLRNLDVFTFGTHLAIGREL